MSIKTPARVSHTGELLRILKYKESEEKRARGRIRKVIVIQEVRGEVVGEETLWCTVRVVFAAAAAASAAAGALRIVHAGSQLRQPLLLHRRALLTSSPTAA